MAVRFQSVIAVWMVLLISSGWASTEDDITNVHLVFMNHLDVGYSLPNQQKGYVLSVLNKYFQEYFPRAVDVSLQLRGIGYQERFIYTTHPWLVSLYLDCPANLTLLDRQLQCPDEKAVADFTAAVKRGDITWHAGPMNMEFELMDRTMLEFAIQLSIDLDKKLNITRKHRTVSQRDVPGTTQAIIPVLEKMGVEAISIGVNGATVPAAVPSVFNWQFANASVMVMYHPGGYPKEAGQLPIMPGGLSRKDCHMVPGLRHALCFAFRSDNTGPPVDYKEVLGNYEVVRSQFPNAVVQASTFEAFTAELINFKSKLPVVTQEIGDVWIQGSQSDPIKVQLTRNIYKMWSDCLHSGKCSFSDPDFYSLSRYLLKLTEHTWGLAGNCVDNIHWTNNQFHKLLQNQSGDYYQAAGSWTEQRDFLFVGLQPHHHLYSMISEMMKERQQILTAALKPNIEGYSSLDDRVFQCKGFTLKFAEDGSLIQLTDPQNQEWASPDNPIGKYVYQTYNQSDFDKFFSATVPFSKTFFLGIGKPNISKNASPQSAIWSPVVKQILANKEKCSLLVEMVMEDDVTLEYYGAPPEIFLNYTIVYEESSTPGIDLMVFHRGKSPTRMPEEISLIFSPPPKPGYRWMMNKIDEMVDPLNVVTNGSQLLHAVNRGIYYTDSDMKGLEILTQDTGLVNVLTKEFGLTNIPFPSNTLTDITGMAFNLFNNVWETNYIFWYPFDPNEIVDFYRFRLNMKT